MPKMPSRARASATRRPKKPVTAELRTLPGRLKEAIEDAQLDQKEVAEEGGISESSVSRIVGGKYPNLRADTVVRLARALGVRAGWLLTGEEPQAGAVPIVVPHAVAQDASVHELTERVAQLLDRLPGPRDEAPRARHGKRRP